MQEDHSPRGALWRAAAVPGWGQLYNRQYVKLPFVYLGLGGVTALMLRTNNSYLLHRRAFLYKANEELVDRGVLEENPWPQFADEYRTLIDQAADGREIGSEPIRARRDNLRRNRDLLIFGIGIWYGLTLLDAYVSAHLLDFDVGEDLTLRLHPHGVSATIHFAR